jgi:TonB family protein
MFVRKSKINIDISLKIAAFIVIAIISFTQVQAQSTPAPTGSGRKVTARVAPAYPELAKKMHIQGTVKVEAVVRPNGTVKSTRILGGNPVLIEAASDAVKKWKYEAGQSETTEVAQLTFESQ